MLIEDGGTVVIGGLIAMQDRGRAAAFPGRIPCRRAFRVRSGKRED
jgi:hypothetical protein